MERRNCGNFNYLPNLLIAIALSAIYGCSSIVIPKKQSINAVFSVPVTNPWMRKLAAVTKRVDIEASGEFKAGNYKIHGHSMSIPASTLFKVEISFPVDDSNVINTGNICGQLWTSQAIHSHGVVLPRLIVLKNGRVSGEIDFVKTLATFLVNVIEEELPSESEASGMRDLIGNLNVKRAVLNLRSDSIFATDKQIFHIGDSSTIELSDLVMDSTYNYAGQCKVDLRFLAGNKWTGRRVDCSFDGGGITLLLNIVRSKNNLDFTLMPGAQQLIVLKDSLYKFGKDMRSSALCRESAVKVREFLWNKNGDKVEADFHVLADLALTKTQLKVQTERCQTTAFFPETEPAKIRIDSNEKRRETQFQTTDTALAKTAAVEITRPTSKLYLLLQQARISPMNFDKGGNLDFAFAKGIAKLQELQWHNGKRYLKLKSAGISELGIPKGMLLSLDKNNAVKMSLPLRIHMGSATVEGSLGRLALRAIDGKILIDIDNEVAFQGDIDFILQESSFLGSHDIAVEVQGIRLSSKRSRAVAHLKKCSLLITNQDLQEIIQKQFPNKQVLDIDKTIFEKRHWRYRNAQIKTISLGDLKLERLAATGNNSAKMVVSADVEMKGTIDKSSVTAILKEPKKYQSKPWRIRAHCIGTGMVEFKFLPNRSLSQSELPYTLTINLPIPEGLNLDWSQVAGGMFHDLERGVILSTIRKMGSVQVTHKGLQPFFNKNHSQLDAIELSDMVTKATPNGMQVDFVADATF